MRLGFIFLIFSVFTLCGEETQSEQSSQFESSFHPFTGKITGNRVRVRVQPTIDSPVVKQLSKGDMFIILGESEDFYSIAPLGDTKAYIHRKFILDNAVEGSKVNVRLEPDLDAPIVGQMNTGDKVNGIISEKNNKWLEISPPDSARFYIAKEYVENIGAPSIFYSHQKKKERLHTLFQSALTSLDREMNKPFNEIQINEPLEKLREIAGEESEFPELAAKSQDILSQANKEYLQKKIAYLEQVADNSSGVWKRKNEDLKEQTKTQSFASQETPIKKELPAPKSREMQVWEPVELSLYEQWVNDRDSYADFETYYLEQEQDAKVVQGVIKPYNQKLKNRPGDFVLVNEVTGVPIAYLYSTKVNLEEKMGSKVALKVAERPNYNFAFPAYFVLSFGS